MFWKVNKRGFHKVPSFLRFSDIALVIIRKIWNHPLNFAEYICINLKYYKSTSQICYVFLMMIKKNFQILRSFNWKKKSVFTCDTCVTLYIMLNQISCKRIILSYSTGNNTVAFELAIFSIFLPNISSFKLKPNYLKTWYNNMYIYIRLIST